RSFAVSRIQPLRAAPRLFSQQRQVSEESALLPNEASQILWSEDPECAAPAAQPFPPPADFRTREPRQSRGQFESHDSAPRSPMASALWPFEFDGSSLSDLPKRPAASPRHEPPSRMSTAEVDGRELVCARSADNQIGSRRSRLHSITREPVTSS